MCMKAKSACVAMHACSSRNLRRTFHTGVCAGVCTEACLSNGCVETKCKVFGMALCIAKALDCRCQAICKHAICAKDAEATKQVRCMLMHVRCTVRHTAGLAKNANMVHATCMHAPVTMDAIVSSPRVARTTGS